MAQLLEYRIDMEDRSKWEIVSANPTAKQTLMYLQEAGMFYSGPGYYTTRKNLRSYLIKLTLSGKGALTYKDSVYDIKPGDFFWIDCNEHQDYRTAKEPGHWHVLWIHFYGGGAANYYQLFQQLNRESPVGHLSDVRKAKQIMELILQLYDDSSGQIKVDIQGANLLTQLLSLFLESISSPSTPRLPQTISSIRDYLFEHYNQNITLDTLSAQFNISKFYLLRTFQHHLGLSPNDYLQNIRVTKAKELLRTTEHSISMVANSVGFESTSYFISVFKKQEGVTPLKYRHAWSNGLMV